LVSSNLVQIWREFKIQKLKFLLGLGPFLIPSSPGPLSFLFLGWPTHRATPDRPPPCYPLPPPPVPNGFGPLLDAVPDPHSSQHVVVVILGPFPSFTPPSPWFKGPPLPRMVSHSPHHPLLKSHSRDTPPPHLVRVYHRLPEFRPEISVFEPPPPPPSPPR
jgi:hypothetical protein